MKTRKKCPLCRSNNFITIEKMGLSNAKLFSKMDSEYNCGSFLKKNNYIYELRFCSDCGTRYQCSVLDDKDTSNFYSNNINPSQSFMKQVRNYKKNFIIRKKTAKLISRLLHTNTKKEYKVLEVGAGWGFFANIGSKLNLKFTTLEISKERRKFHRFLNLDTIKSFEEAKDMNLKFDVIYSNQVIEHVTDLRSFIYESSKLLEKGGFFIAEYPSYNNFVHYLFKRENYFKDMRTKALEHLQLISDRGAMEIIKSIKNFQYIHFLPVRKLDDIIKNFVQYITPSKHKGSGFLIAKKIK